MKKAILIIMALSAIACSVQTVDPCDLDPFCDDPDLPEQIPLDSGLIGLLTAAFAYGMKKIKKRKRSSP